MKVSTSRRKCGPMSPQNWLCHHFCRNRSGNDHGLYIVDPLKQGTLQNPPPPSTTLPPFRPSTFYSFLMVLYPRATALIATSLLAALSVTALPRVSRTGRYLYQEDGSRFFIKGIAYQAQGKVLPESYGVQD